jgi:oxygen-dependent protoporphyrinogen oxidase
VRVVVTGAGIAGLSVAWALRRRQPDADVIVLERASRTGGNIRTDRIDGYLCESGPQGFLDNEPATLELVRELGLRPRLQPCSDAARHRYVFRHDRLHEVPMSPPALIRSRLLSIKGKARIACEPFVRRGPVDDESIHEFAARRIGTEAAEVLVDAMVSGIFGGNARALSLQACFPRMAELERTHGSLIRAQIALARAGHRTQAIGAPAGRLTSFAGGMSDLTNALTVALGKAVRPSTAAVHVHEDHPPRRFVVATSDGRIDADAVVLAGPAAESARVLRGIEPELADLVGGIPTAPMTVVCLGYDAAALNACCPLKGFGFLVPRIEPVRILGVLWENQIFPDRAPRGKALLRVMVGGAGDPGILALDDERVLAIVQKDLRTTMGLTIDPEFVRIVRHTRGIPQYVKGHVARMEQIAARLRRHRGLYLAGNSYRGVSVNSCVAEAGRIADTLIEDYRRASADALLSSAALTVA